MITVHKLLNILRNRECMNKWRICTKWLEEKCVQVERVEGPSTGIYWHSGIHSCHSAQQLLASSLVSIYVCISVRWASRKLLKCYTHNFPSLHTRHQSHQYLWATEERETNFSGKLYSICLTSCEAWHYSTCVGCEHGLILVSHDNAKGVVACETWSEPRLAVGMRPRAKRTCLLSLLDVRNSIFIMLVFLLYEQ